MASRYEPTLRELAMEPDEERRLEMASSRRVGSYLASIP